MSSGATSLRMTWARAMRLAIVVLVVAAQASDLATTGPLFAPPTYYLFFTVLSNLLAAVIAGWGLIGRAPDSLRGLALGSLLITALVVMTLLGGIQLDRDTFGAIMMHGVTAVFAIADWLLAPPRRRLPVSAVWWWTLFPLTYLAFSLVRGAMVNWYPYPFLDPSTQGYPAVALTCVFIAITYIAVSFLVRWLGNMQATRR